MSMTVLKKDLATGLDLLAEVLTPSTFPQEEIDRQKQSIIASIKARRGTPGDIAQRDSLRRFILKARTGGRSKGSEASVKGTGTAKPREPSTSAIIDPIGLFCRWWAISRIKRLPGH